MAHAASQDIQPKTNFTAWTNPSTVKPYIMGEAGDIQVTSSPSHPIRVLTNQTTASHHHRLYGIGGSRIVYRAGQGHNGANVSDFLPFRWDRLRPDRELAPSSPPQHSSNMSGSQRKFLSALNPDMQRAMLTSTLTYFFPIKAKSVVVVATVCFPSPFRSQTGSISAKLRRGVLRMLSCLCPPLFLSVELLRPTVYKWASFRVLYFVFIFIIHLIAATSPSQTPRDFQHLSLVMDPPVDQTRVVIIIRPVPPPTPPKEKK